MLKTVLIINTIIAVVVFIWDLIRKKGKYSLVHLLVILFCPVVGPVFFFGAFLFEITFNKKWELKYEDIGFDTTRRQKKVKKGFFEQIDILPLEEAFAVSARHDRRKALLTALKRDYKKNISSVQLGLNNDDGETSHYAASAILSLTTEYLNKLTILRGEYEKNKDSSVPAREYADTLIEFMQGEILDSIDKKKYSKSYVEIIEWMYKNFKNDVLVSDYVYALNLSTELGDYKDARVWSGRAIEHYPDEDVLYYIIMKIYYKLEKYDEFLQMMRFIMNSTINISNETLQIIRFFNYNPNPDNK